VSLAVIVFSATVLVLAGLFVWWVAPSLVADWACGGCGLYIPGHPA